MTYEYFQNKELSLNPAHQQSLIVNTKLTLTTALTENSTESL